MNTTIQEAIVQTLQSGGWLTFFVIFWSGAILSLSSCTIIRIPIIVGYVGGASTSKKRAFLLTLSFVAALVVSYTALGVLFGLLSGLMDSMIRWSQYIYYVIGALAFFIGIQMTGIIDIGLFRHKECGIHHPQRIGLLGAFLFGLVFAIFEAPTCPCCGQNGRSHV